MVWTEPSDEQLVNFAALSVFGAGYTPGDRACVEDILLSYPVMKDLWLEHHRTSRKPPTELGAEHR